MPKNLEQRLREARQKLFVGRENEKELFRCALEPGELEFTVLYLFGPGGVGKSSLLDCLTSLTSRAGVPWARLDGREIDASPQPFLEALAAATGVENAEKALKLLVEAESRFVLMIDAYEFLAALDRWLRQDFLPQISDQVLVVIAGQKRPAAPWRTEPGWQALFRALPMRNLSPPESREYLARRGVPSAHYARLLALTHGFPLAISLAADAYEHRGGKEFEIAIAPDVIREILRRLLREAPGPAYRSALEACALVHITNEALLGELLATQDAATLFDWLRGLSFIESRRGGLSPHEVARQALISDLRWRNSERYELLQSRARAYYSRRVVESSGGSQQAMMIDYIYLHRENPIVRPFLEELRAQGGGLDNQMLDSPHERDWAALKKIVADLEGDESAALAAGWFEHQPENVTVWRGVQGEITGFLAKILLQSASPDLRERDPATHKAWRYLQANAPLRAGEQAVYFRFWMAKDSHQAISPLQSLIFVQMALYYLTMNKLAFSFLPSKTPDFWAPLLAYADLQRLPEVEFEVGGQRYGVFVHDWRVIPPLTWLDRLAQRELAITPASAQSEERIEPLVVLSQSEFRESVRQALRDFNRPENLKGNSLLRSRLALEGGASQSGLRESVENLRRRIISASQGLRGSPRREKFYRALELTYFRPAPTQEKAAERLDLPFRTFRRHLKSGIDEVTEILWRWEVGLDEEMPED